VSGLEMVSDVWDVVNVNRDIRECVICGKC
jgi:hypothetical protein